MFRFLTKPYYLELDPIIYAKKACLIGLFVFVFLFVFRPFGLQNVPSGILPVTIGYGLVTVTLILLLFGVVRLFANSVFDPEKWNLGKELLWGLVHVFVIGLGNVIYSNVIGLLGLSAQSIFWFQVFTMAVGLFPMTVFLLLSEKRDTEKYASKADDINSQLNREAVHASTTSESVTLTSGTNEADLLVDINQLMYIKAANNYVEVYVLAEGGEVQKTLLRSTMKQAEEALVSYDLFFRCHKSYIVNLHMVQRLSGNAQGYKLHIAGHETPVPVSRQHNQSIQSRLTIRP